MIELFAYTNKAGKKSIKIVGTTGQRFDSNDKRTFFGGISLGKVLFNSSLELEEVLESLKDYTVLNHMPKKGEGLPEYNECFKMFNTSQVYCWIGTLDPKLLKAEDLEKTIMFLKGLTEDEQDKLSEVISETDYEDSDALKFLPLPILAVISTSSTSNEVRKTAGLAMAHSTPATRDYWKSTIKQEPDSDVIKNLRALARSLGYDIVKL